MRTKKKEKVPSHLLDLQSCTKAELLDFLVVSGGPQVTEDENEADNQDKKMD